LRSADKAFTFYLKDWKVKVYDDREKKYFQKDGEEEFVWDRDLWDWFVKKIEYTDNEPINLIIIVNDTDDFGLKMSSCQMIAEKFSFFCDL
jgi:ribosome biogenesis protein Nip4